FFHEVSAHGESVIAKVVGNYDHTTPIDLGRLVWPQVSHGFAAQTHRVLDQLGTAVGQHRSASGLPQVWSQANLGRGDVLLVEDTYRQTARGTEAGGLELKVDDPSAPDVLENAVDEVITAVLSKGGRVVFVEDGNLVRHGRIALILRY